MFELVVEGRHICSRVNPVREANLLLQRHLAFAESAKSIFLIGLGGGHLVKILREKYSKKALVVFEMRDAIVDFVKAHAQGGDVQFTLMRSSVATDIFQNEIVNSMMKASYCIIRQSYTRKVDREDYDRVEDALIGRKPSAFGDLMRLRPEVRSSLRPLVDANGLASIMTLTQNINTDATPREPKLIIKALRELVV